MCQYDFEIILNIQNKYKDSQVIVPRWDIALLQPLLIDQDAIVCGKISRMSKKLSDHPILYNDFTQKHFISELSLAISQTKTLIEEKIAASANGRDLSAYTDAYLILSRSLPPSYYVETKYKVGWLRSICAGIFGNKNHVKRGKSERLGYGVSRRGLLGIQAAKKKLLESEIPVEVFEPGQFSLTEQIKVFQSCKGIIAIKGAEFANLIWLKPHSQVILIKPLCMNTVPYQKKLADILDLNYIEIETDQGNYPKLDPEILEQYLVQS